MRYLFWWFIRFFMRFKTEQEMVIWELEHGVRKTFFLAVNGKMSEFEYAVLSKDAKLTLRQLLMNSSDQKEMKEYIDKINKMNPKKFRQLLEKD